MGRHGGGGGKRKRSALVFFIGWATPGEVAALRRLGGGGGLAKAAAGGGGEAYMEPWNIVVGTSRMGGGDAMLSSLADTPHNALKVAVQARQR